MISPEYPLLPPRFVLTSPRATGGPCLHDPRLHALEQELNAGCVDLVGLHDRLVKSTIGPPPLDVVSGFTACSAGTEECIDGVLGLQLLLLQAILPASTKLNQATLTNMLPRSDFALPVNTKRVGGKTKKKVSIKALYGREYCT